ncbi:hypothetical protein E9228_002785 [Curtobacterium flaccumfaciens]|uniref:Uncharacterized protein n=1 Tax=Curtobacterium salicis TaxID=1779862 RepID=A0ABX0T9F8_9MICO|nr:hypothetical protein [Curtobacterium sp. WW7]NII42127.1 hypothetical protein [Curtobacterium sp. WW7]
MAADGFKVQAKAYDTEIKLLAQIDKAIEDGWPTQQIQDLALAYRYVLGGNQPGAVVIKK